MVASSYPRFPGDIAGTFVQALALALSELGHQVGVVAPADPLAVTLPKDTIPVLRFPYSPLKCLHPMGYGKALEGDQRLRPAAYAFAAPFFLSETLYLLRSIRRWDSQVVHVHWVLPNGPAGVLAARLAGRPVVITLHGSDLYLAQRKAPLRWIAARSLGAAQAVTACSPALLEGAQELRGAPTGLHLIPWGGDADRFSRGNAEIWRERLAIAPGSPVVLGVGRLVAKKGFEYLVRAFQQVLSTANSRHDSFPGCSDSPVLVLGGDGAQRRELETLAYHAKVGEQVRFCGRVPWGEMPALLALADVVVVPSVRDSQGNQDGLPTVALEAMAAGKPVVASALGGLPLVVEDGQTGLLVPPGQVEALAEALTSLLQEPAKARALGKAGQARVERELSWRAVARQYADVYREVLGLG